jgi:hypothetical protein
VFNAAVQPARTSQQQGMAHSRGLFVVSGSKIFVSRKSAPNGAQRFIFSELALGGFQLCDAMEKHHRFGCDLLDVSDAGALSATFKNAGDARAQMITLALVLGAHEADLGVQTGAAETVPPSGICHRSPYGVTTSLRSSSP